MVIWLSNPNLGKVNKTRKCPVKINISNKILTVTKRIKLIPDASIYFFDVIKICVQNINKVNSITNNELLNKICSPVVIKPISNLLIIFSLENSGNHFAVSN